MPLPTLSFHCMKIAAIDWCNLATFKAVFAGLDVLRVSLQSFKGLNVMCVVKEGIY